MTHYTLYGASMLVIAATLTVPGGPRRQTQAEQDAVWQFQRATSEYALLHRTIARDLPPLEISPDVGKIQRAMDARAAALRLARADARQGDFFTDEVGVVFRERIHQALAAHGVVVMDLLLEDIDNEEGLPLASPPVHARLTWEPTATMPPCVLAALPELPEELQYRFVWRDLVLVDINANLIVDVLPGALEDVPQAY